MSSDHAPQPEVAVDQQISDRIGKILRFAGGIMIQLGEKPPFMRYCEDNGIAPTEITDDAHWEAVADFAREDKHVLARTFSPQGRDIGELALATPNLVRAVPKIREYREGTLRMLSYDYINIKRQQKHYQELLSKFMDRFPAFDRDRLLEHLTAIAQIGWAHRRENPMPVIRGYMRGVMAERDFFALSAHFKNIKVEAADYDTDVIDGVDALAKLPPNDKNRRYLYREVHVDIKAGETSYEKAIEGHGVANVRRFRSDNYDCTVVRSKIDGSHKLILRLKFADASVRENFNLPQDVIKNNAPELEALLLDIGNKFPVVCRPVA